MSDSIPYDPEKAALLVIDMQEFFRSDVVDKIIPNVKSIVLTCHKKGIPVLWTQHGHMNVELDGGALARWWKNKDEMLMRGSEKWQIFKELDSIVERSPTSIGTLDFIIKSKTRYDAFYKTELDSFLTSLGIKTLIISGVKTNLCCETTAKRAFDENYDIVFLEDATATDTKEMHEAALLNIGYGWGIVTTVNNTTKWLSTHEK
ncbi:11254_t:CDS:2 [Scutellospora calospora]|uniref:11254_t:CDS:1 n=1 Tax=Scutellospora calospora TaxID=85575 RepID=A0ACA9L2G3_9GLOM|nr:11254_t:CDS:2 [Scutellospora calospora]